jgi:hypothetical protein
MKKIILVSSLLTTFILADSHLGKRISTSHAQEEIIQNHGSSQEHQPLETRVSPKNVKRSFKKDHHRYDKRYSNFNYDRNGYYNDEGFYFGYYDTTGYFYNNIFFAYNSNYTYNDRHYRRGFFRVGHRHLRPYVYHSFNDWNRVHCYREPNVIVRGHYYNRNYYPRHSSSSNVRNQYSNNRPHRYNNPHQNHIRGDYYQPHSGHSRMHVTRMQENRANSRSQNRSYNYNSSNNFRNSISQRERPRGNYSRMHTRGSSQPHRGGGRHMGISK